MKKSSNSNCTITKYDLHFFLYFFIIVFQQHKIDLRDEEPEQMAKRMFTFLRILKFKPKTDSGSL